MRGKGGGSYRFIRLHDSNRVVNVGKIEFSGLIQIACGQFISLHFYLSWLSQNTLFDQVS